jgi:hypothetical protein
VPEDASISAGERIKKRVIGVCRQSAIQPLLGFREAQRDNEGGYRIKLIDNIAGNPDGDANQIGTSPHRLKGLNVSVPGYDVQSITFPEVIIILRTLPPGDCGKAKNQQDQKNQKAFLHLTTPLCFYKVYSSSSDAFPYLR